MSLLVLSGITVNLVLYFVFNYSQRRGIGSDHYFHIKLIRRIKNNNHKFVKDYVINRNEENPFYPQLFHWILSYVNSKILNKNQSIIDIFIVFIEVIIFNYFVIRYFNFNDIEVFQLNLAWALFPFNYIGWNAKNKGISARQFGLSIGRVFLVFLFIYINESSVLNLSILILIYIITTLSSQFSFQFINFFIIIISILYLNVFIFLIIPISLCILFVYDFDYFNKYFTGQFYHKFNVYKYVSNFGILKNRKGIYKDFCFDFWKKLFNEKITTSLNYIRHNPVVEVAYGFPLIFIIFYNYNYLSLNYNLELRFILIGFAIFFLTSFSFSRFLGEPQRYVEFLIPFISFLSILVGSKYIFVILILSFSTILLNIIIDSKVSSSHTVNSLIVDLKKYFSNIDSDLIVTSNDAELLKYITLENIEVLRNDPSKNYYNPTYDYYFVDDHASISEFSLVSLTNKWKPDYLIINKSIYDISHNLSFDKYKLSCNFKNIAIYSIS